MNRIHLIRFVLLMILLVAITFLSISRYRHRTSLISPIPDLKTASSPNPTHTPTPKVFKLIGKYNPPKVRSSDSYTILFIGDSMTAALGENFDELRKDLAIHFPNKVFGLFNYGFGSTNILSFDERLHKDTNYGGKTLPAILGRYFDIIIIESFAYNPLSEYSESEGLIRQNETLNKIVAELADVKPDSLIIFLATIAPSKQLYGQGATKVSIEERTKAALERIHYLENHIAYAKNHNIPLINVYESSLDNNKNALLKYINSDDHIHPSAAGVKFISQNIADYLNENNILPK